MKEKVPARMFDLFGASGSDQFSVVALSAILLVSIVQNAGLSHNMGICGSAKNELAARSGVSGNYLKRIMIILWAFAGLIAVAMFGTGGLSDPDAAWGAMSNRLLGPGLIGLILCCAVALCGCGGAPPAPQPAAPQEVAAPTAAAPGGPAT